MVFLFSREKKTEPAKSINVKENAKEAKTFYVADAAKHEI